MILIKQMIYGCCIAIAFAAIMVWACLLYGPWFVVCKIAAPFYIAIAICIVVLWRIVPVEDK